MTACAAIPVRRIEGVLEVLDAPDPARAPVVLDSPHSGTAMPAGSRHAAPDAALDSAVDRFVHDLVRPAVGQGAALLHALFPRTFVDVNRAADDIDPALVDGDPGFPLNPTRKSATGFGLLRGLVLPGVPMYAGPLPAAEVRAMVERYWQPYHAALEALLDARHARFGAVWHLDCHSMKSVGNAMNEDAGAERPDIVVSDYLGETASPDFTAFVAEAFRRRGYRTNVNDPYRGDYLIRRYADPAAGREALQIEINRRVYLDEARCVPNGGYARFASDLETVLAEIVDWARGRLPAQSR
ncbi:MAG: N-formylglutamate amidohydrolase [Azospirillaceae bacterium]